MKTVKIDLPRAQSDKRIAGWVEIIKQPKTEPTFPRFGFRFSYDQKQVLAWLYRLGLINNDSDVKVWRIKITY